MNRLKSILASYMIACILLNTLAVPLIYIDFELRKDYISKVLCIERDNPITTCAGKCYLGKQLKSISEQQENDDKAAQNNVQITFFSEMGNAEPLHNQAKLLTNKYDTRVGLLYSHSHLRKIFQPPRIS